MHEVANLTRAVQQVQPAASTSRSVPNTPPQSAAPARFPESFEVWEAAAISRILGVTLDVGLRSTSE